MELGRGKGRRSSQMGIAREHYTLLLSICISLFFAPLMVAGVNAVLPEISADLSASAISSSMVGAIYSLGLAIVQLLCGSLGDIAGHRRIFLFGAVIFGLCGLLLAVMDNMGLFLGLRLVQGAGAAMLSASGLALLASCAPSPKRPLYLSFSSAAVYSGIACGPTIAGFIAGFANWRWIFGLNFLASCAVFILMKYTVVHDWRPATGKSFDYKGALLYSLAMTAFMASASILAQSRLAGILALACFVVLLLAFCLHEKNCLFPILNIRLLFHNRVLSLSSLAALVNYGSIFGLVFYFSYYLQTGKGLNVRETGLILSLQAIFQVICTPLAVRLCKKWPHGHISAAGAFICGTGLLLTAVLELSSPLWVLFMAQAFLGAGISIFSLANTAIILDSAGQKNIGQASSLSGSMRTIGQLTSMTIITMTLSLIIGEVAIAPDTLALFMKCMRADLIIFGSMSLCAVGMSIVRNRV